MPRVLTKYISDRRKNSLKEDKLEFAPEALSHLQYGCKQFTLRKGKREFMKSITINGKPAVVNHFKHYTLMHMPLDILVAKGFKSMFHALMEMKKYYPDLDMNSVMTVVEFYLEVPPAHVGSTRFL
jgi:hypothetical protein